MNSNEHTEDPKVIIKRFVIAHSMDDSNPNVTRRDCIILKSWIGNRPEMKAAFFEFAKEQKEAASLYWRVCQALLEQTGTLQEFEQWIAERVKTVDENALFDWGDEGA